MATYKLKVFTRTRAELQTLENLKVSPPASLLVPLIRNLRQINAVLRDFDEAMSRVVREVGRPDGRGGWQVPTDDADAVRRYYAEQDDAVETEVEVDLHPIPLSRFLAAMQKKPSFEVPIRALIRLDYLIPIDAEVPPDLLEASDG